MHRRVFVASRLRSPASEAGSLECDSFSLADEGGGRGWLTDADVACNGMYRIQKFNLNFPRRDNRWVTQRFVGVIGCKVYIATCELQEIDLLSPPLVGLPLVLDC